MTNIFESVVLGIVQGVTEWLPVSSSGHLALLQHFFDLKPNIFFNVLLHVGTLGVLLLFFRKDLVNIASKLAQGKIHSDEAKTALFVAIGTIPTALIGLLFRSFFEELFGSPALIGLALIITAFVLFLTKTSKQQRGLNWTDAILLGAVQGLALAPGISRSGLTIGVALLLGIHRAEAVKFSFLLAIPAIAGAATLVLIETGFAALSLSVIAGTLIAFIVGYFALRLVVNSVLSNRFWLFGYYCAALGAVLVILNIR